MAGWARVAEAGMARSNARAVLAATLAVAKDPAATLAAYEKCKAAVARLEATQP